MTAMLMPSRRAIFFKSRMSKIVTPARDCCPTFERQGVEQRADLEAFLAEPRVVRQREPEVARADDRHPKLAVEAEDLPEMPLEIADVVADAANAEFTEVGEVLANLRGVQTKLLRQRLG